MSVYRKPGDMLDHDPSAIDGKSRLRGVGSMVNHCTERATERGDTWEMSILNSARKEWASGNADRVRQMAALFLGVACDWEYSEVAIALGYSGKQPAHNAAKIAAREIKKIIDVRA